MQLRGFNLVPFTFDKQVLLMETLLHLWTCALSRHPRKRHTVSHQPTIFPGAPLWTAHSTSTAVQLRQCLSKRGIVRAALVRHDMHLSSEFAVTRLNATRDLWTLITTGPRPRRCRLACSTCRTGRRPPWQPATPRAFAFCSDSITTHCCAVRVHKILTSAANRCSMSVYVGMGEQPM